MSDRVPLTNATHTHTHLAGLRTLRVIHVAEEVIALVGATGSDAEHTGAVHGGVRHLQYRCVAHIDLALALKLLLL